MTNSLPPLKALRAFESAGRHLSFRKAAAELHVTPAAVSHQIKLLEDHLGVVLFRRLTRAIELTDIGRAFLPRLTEGFEHVAHAVNGVRNYQKTGSLAVCVPPSFAAKWLMPRLHRFVKAYPDIDIRISTSLRLVDPRKSGIPGDDADDDCENTEDMDLAIRFGTGKYPGYRADKLFEVSFTPLCSPHLIEESSPLCQPADLSRYPLLHDDLHDLSDGWATWDQWFAAARLKAPPNSRGPHFSQPILGLEAAIDGAGIALGARELAAFDIAAGRLVAPFPVSVTTGAGYYAISSKANAGHLKIGVFRNWLLRESREVRKAG